MKKLSVIVSLFVLLGVMSQARPPQPPPEDFGGSKSGNNGFHNNQQTPAYFGATTLKNTTTQTNKIYKSTISNQNAVLVSNGTVTLKNASISKSGNGTGGESGDFYGTNAAVLVYNGATVDLIGGKIDTNGAYANGVFSYGKGAVNLSNTIIHTQSRNSGGLMVAGGGLINAKNVTVTTEGGSSAPIRSDRGGGKIIISGGTFTSNGQGSPAIYSTADIRVKNATLQSASAEGIVIEGANSVLLNHVNLTDNNITLNGQSTTYKNIFLYQSMSGDAKEGKSYFTAKNSTITTHKGDTLYVTNTTSSIVLENNTFINKDQGGYFLRAKADSWGRSGNNGGQVTLFLTNQTVNGDIYIDTISTLTMTLGAGAHYTGAINTANTGKKIILTLDKESTLTLTADSYVTSVKNTDTTGKNIILNGYKLHVGEAVTGKDQQEAHPKNFRNQNFSEKNSKHMQGQKSQLTWSEKGNMLGKRPSKKPNAKPGGDRIPPDM